MSSLEDILASKEVERVIEFVARSFDIPGTEFEDRVQIGRIAVWKAVEKYKRENIAITHVKAFVRKTVETELLSELRSSKRLKRVTLSKSSSLDATLSTYDDRTFYDVLPARGENGLDAVLRKEYEEELLKKLRKRSFKERTPESKQAVVWLLVHMLGLSREEIPRKINYQTFVDHGLQAWLWVFFNNSPFRAINFAYPGEFLPYHMARAPQRYWKSPGGRDRAIDALRQVLKETGCAEEHYPHLLTQRFFEEFKLTSPLWVIFRNIAAYLDAAFPGRYHPWECPRTPKFFFDSEENVRRAVRWLVEEKLGYPMGRLTIHEVWDMRIAQKITKEVFGQYGLREVMAIYKSPEPVLRLVYPGKFLPWSFQRKKKWMGESGKKLAAEATRWLIEDHLHLAQSSAEIDCNFFRKNGLWGMLTAKHLGFNTSPTRALKNAYPHSY